MTKNVLLCVESFILITIINIKKQTFLEQKQVIEEYFCA